MATSSFKPRTVSPERVAAIEAITATVPNTGDQKAIDPVSPLTPVISAPVSVAELAPQEVGSRQLNTADGTSRYVIGTVYDIPVNQIKSNPYNPRAVYTKLSVDEMAQSLSANGQRISATAYIDENNEVVLIEGETRLRGCREIGTATLRVEIRPAPTDNQALYEEARGANVDRNDQTPLDDAIRWKEYLAKKLYPNQIVLAERLKLKKDHVSRVISLSSLSTRVINALAELPDLLNLRMLNAIREFSEVVNDDDVTLELIFEAAKNGMGYREVESRRKAFGKEPVKRTRSTRSALSFRGAKGEFRSFENEGRIELSLQDLTPESAKEITEKLLALFPKA